jgi:hypothetical protein
MRWLFVTLLVVSFPCKAMAQSDAEKIARAVKTCIDFVRSLPGEYRGQFVSFDAYVDPATGGVKYYGTPSAGFQFAKCLGDRGLWMFFPLFLGLHQDRQLSHMNRRIITGALHHIILDRLQCAILAVVYGVSQCQGEGHQERALKTFQWDHWVLDRGLICRCILIGMIRFSGRCGAAAVAVIATDTPTRRLSSKQDRYLRGKKAESPLMR